MPWFARAFAALVLTALPFLSLAGPAASQPIGLLDIKSNDAAELRATTAGGARVRVTVVLAPAAGIAIAGAADEDIGARLAAVAAAVDAVLADHVAPASGVAPGATAPELGLVRAAAHPIFTLNATAAEIDALAGDPRVANLTRDRQMRIGLGQSVPLIGMPAAIAESNATGAGYAVAILDTGVDTTHPWFATKLVGEACFSGGGSSADSYCHNGALVSYNAGSGVHCALAGQPWCPHGTHVAGIAVGKSPSPNATPGGGVARGAKLIAYQVFSRGGTAWDSDVEAALSDIYARRNSFSVPVASINISIWDFGRATETQCDGFRPSMTAVIDSLRSVGIATVIITGNGGRTNLVSFPGCISAAVSVANSTKSDGIASDSDISSATDVIAPGSDITSAVPNQNFDSMSGTSMAAPHVAGAFAAIRSACAIPMTADGIFAITAALRDSPKIVRDSRQYGIWTAPRIQVDRAVKLMCSPRPDNDDFAHAAPIGQGDQVSARNYNATKEAGEPIHASSVFGTRSLWWSFTATAGGFPMTIATAGSNFDTVLSVYTGNSLGALTVIAANDDAGAGSSASQVEFNVTAGATYRIAVDGFQGTQGDIVLSMGPAPAPLCTLTASAATVEAGELVTFTWSSDYAATAMVAGLGALSPASGGSLTLIPPQSGTWTALFEGPGGEASCDVSVAVTGAGHGGQAAGAFEPLTLLVLSTLGLTGRRRRR